MIISVGLAGVLMVFNTVTRNSADPIRAKQALAVAEGMMDEILGQNFCDPDNVTSLSATPITCNPNTLEGDRSLFDSVDDYNSYTRDGIRDISSDAAIVLPGYRVNVGVENPAPFVVLGDSVATTNYRIITVTVIDDYSNQSYVLSAYKFNND